jgi:dTDP-glucose 4,6-dehydratase
MWLITGGAGFIGGNFVLRQVAQGRTVINLDALTYAGNLQTLKPIIDSPQHRFVKGDICDRALLDELLTTHRPNVIVHFAAESHVDRSIEGPRAFVETNVLGTLTMLEAALKHWRSLDGEAKQSFRFLHVSTDEVYGSLGETGRFSETTAYAPNSPYSASKAASDHLVRAFHHTFGLPTLTTNCSNNYGPYQFPEKLIPLMIQKALSGADLPVYGDGKNVRDWLYVEDHCRAIECVLERGALGEVYNVGGDAEMQNIEVVQVICGHLDALRPTTKPYASQIHFVSDRPGHDRRYAIDASKLKALGWRAEQSFSSGIKHTIDWYLEHAAWVSAVMDGSYRGERLGTA